MINHNKKILFIDITKTAGTAIIETLQELYPKEKWEGKHHSVKNFTADGTKVINGRPTCSKVTNEILKNYKTFTVVRNPFDRMVSTWHWGLNGDYRNTTFEEFIINVHKNKYTEFNGHRYKTQLDWITNENGDIKVQHILRWENLQEELDNFFTDIDFEPIKIYNRNTAKDRSGRNRTHYRDYYNEETKRIIEEKYQEDLNFFEYQF